MAIRFGFALLVYLLSAAPSFAQSADSEFTERVAAYASLQASLGAAPAVEANAVHLAVARDQLADRIRHSRAAAAVGDIFTPRAAREFSTRLRNALDAPTWAAVMDDNPGEFPCFVNADYPEEMPLSRVPTTLLVVLPTLPEGLEYRFVGRHLILRDRRANVIVDYVPYALASCDCDQEESF